VETEILGLKKIRLTYIARRCYILAMKGDDYHMSAAAIDLRKVIQEMVVPELQEIRLKTSTYGS